MPKIKNGVGSWVGAFGGNKLSSLFENMLDGFAYHKMLFDPEGRPVDYVFLEVNEAFERLTGLKRERILGKPVTEVLPGIAKDPADWIGVYGKVVLTGEPLKFENYSEALDKWFVVSAYSPEKGYFVASFEDITARKNAEAKMQQQDAILEGINKIFGEALSTRTETELGEICLSVAEEITQSQFGFIGEINPKGLD